MRYVSFFFFKEEDGIRVWPWFRGLGNLYKRQNKKGLPQSNQLYKHDISAYKGRPVTEKPVRNKPRWTPGKGAKMAIIKIQNDNLSTIMLPIMNWLLIQSASAHAQDT